MSDFEITNLADLPWFEKLFHALGGSDKHLPDCFHLWTARCNALDVLLTLEKKLPRSVEQLRRRRHLGFDINVKVLRPTELLQVLDIVTRDQAPLKFDRFYTYMEIFTLRRNLLSY